MVVDVQNVSIRYLLGDFKDIGIKEYLVQKLTGTYEMQEFWAVKNVSFSLNAGDFLGIIGTNGTGYDGDPTIKGNIYFRGALLGYTEKFMKEKYPEIIEFSEL